MGSFITDIAVGSSSMEAEIIVIRGKGQALLGHKTARDLEIWIWIKIFLLESDLFTKYGKYFSGVEKLENFKLT